MRPMNEEEARDAFLRIEEVRSFLTDSRNPYIAYLETKGHVFDINKINAVLDSYEGGKKCITVMGRAKSYYS